MRNADRLLRIAYKENSLEKLFYKIKTYENALIGFSFSFDNDLFVNDLALDYTKIYPQEYSIEEVKNLIKAYYYDCIIYNHDSSNHDIYNMFFVIAEQLFIVKSGNMLVRFENLLEWDGFCNKVDANIIISAFIAKHEHIKLDEIGAVIGHDNVVLNNLLKNGVSDNHAHLKASGYSAEMNTSSLMLCSFEEDDAIIKFIRRAKLIPNNFARNEDEALLIIKKLKFIRLYLEAYCESFAKKSEMPVLQKDAIAILTAGDDCLFKQKWLKEWLDERLDMLTEEFITKKDMMKYFSIERSFMVRLFRILPKLNNGFLNLVFNIYLAGISQLRFYFVQDNAGMGFKKFKMREEIKEDLLEFNMHSSHKVIDEKELLKSAFDRYYRSGIVKNVEFRIAPKTPDKMNSFLKMIERCNEEVFEKHATDYKEKNIEKINYGIIIHFIKEEFPQEYEDYGWRWEKLRERIAKETDSIQKFLETNSKYSDRIVGVDAANYEIYCRPEVFAPFFRKIRIETAETREMGITYHVGEVFDALCSGLRAIDETIRFINMRRGDRLGHAMALGIDVKQYRKCKRNLCIITLQNLVDNLAWMYYMLGGHKDKNIATLLYFLKDRFDYYCKRLYDRTDLFFSILDYIDSWLLRGDIPEYYIFNDILRNEPWVLNQNKESFNSARNNAIAIKIHLKYLQDKQIFKNGEEIIHLEPQDEYWQALELAQTTLKRQVYEKEIAIETNPSSNHKISHISKLIDLPFLSFNKYGLLHNRDQMTVSNENDLLISINTDDCAIFQSDIANEYALIVAALQKEEYQNQSIYKYIDYLREMSLYQTFILNRRSYTCNGQED